MQLSSSIYDYLKLLQLSFCTCDYPQVHSTILMSIWLSSFHFTISFFTNLNFWLTSVQHYLFSCDYCVQGTVFTFMQLYSCSNNHAQFHATTILFTWLLSYFITITHVHSTILMFIHFSHVHLTILEFI